MAYFPCGTCGAQGAYQGPDWVATASLKPCPSCGNPFATSVAQAAAVTSLTAADAAAESSQAAANFAAEQAG